MDVDISQIPVIPLELIQSKELSPGSKLCWMTLLLASRGLQIHQQQGLADTLGVTQRQVKRYLEELESQGFLDRKKETQDTLYKLVIPHSITGTKSKPITEYFLLNLGSDEGTDKSLGAENYKHNIKHYYYTNTINDTVLFISTFAYAHVEKTTSVKSASAEKRKLFHQLRKSKSKDLISNENTETTIKEFHCPKKLEPFVRYWIEKKLLSSDRTTKTFKKAVDYLNALTKTGNLFDRVEGFESYRGRAFTFEEWKKSVDNFTLSLSPQYYPLRKPKQRVSLGNFILNPFASTNFTISPFIFFLETKPRRVEKILPDENPIVTKCLIEFYQEKVLGGTKEALPVASQNKFIEASGRLYEFFRKCRDRIPNHFALTPYKRAELLWKAIETEVKDSTIITPGFFCSDKTFSERLPSYLFSQRIINNDCD